jgi:hypothetical protein
MGQLGEALPLGGPLPLDLLVVLHGPTLAVGVKRSILEQATLPIDVDWPHQNPFEHIQNIYKSYGRPPFPE